MASSVTSKLRIRTETGPFWLWPNLLSVDAPVIASLWQNLFARDAGVQLSSASMIALPSAVWLIYLLDRLLDTSTLTFQPTARHTFCSANRGLCYFLAGIAASLSSVSALYLPLPVLKNGLAVLSIVAIYLLIIHWAGGSLRRFLPKEAAVGIIFAIGSVLAPLTRSYNSHLLLPCICFGFLCWANSSAIEVWEGGEVDAASAWTVRHLTVLSSAMFMLCLTMALASTVERSWLSLFVVALGFAAIAEFRHALSPDFLRVAIDVPLAAPLFFLLR